MTDAQFIVLMGAIMAHGTAGPASKITGMVFWVIGIVMMVMK